jgi:hypothetical protein
MTVYDHDQGPENMDCLLLIDTLHTKVTFIRVKLHRLGETRLVKSSFKIAIRTCFVTGLVKHCKNQATTKNYLSSEN